MSELPKTLWPRGFASVLGICVLMSGCTPGPFDLAYGTGVALAARDEDDIQDPDTVSDFGLVLAITRAWLDTSRTRFSELDTTVENGAVLVTGSVHTPQDHIEALRIVWSQTGVVSVRSEAGYGATDTDKVLADAIRVRLFDDPSVRPDAYTVEVVGEDVYVLGRAQTSAELDRVVRHARSAGNVRRVVTLVQVGSTDA